MVKKIFLFVLIICGLQVVYAQKKPIKQPKKVLETVYIRDNFYADEIEISVEDWVYFIGYKLHVEGGDSARKMLPDLRLLAPQAYQLLNIVRDLCQREPGDAVMLATNNLGEILQPLTFVEQVNKSKESLLPATEFPITGISYEQAKAFCAWRTNQITELLNSGSKKAKKLGLQKAIFRLPTPAEADSLLALCQDPNQDGQVDSVFIKTGCRLWNYSRSIGCPDDGLKVQTYGKQAMMRYRTYDPIPQGFFDVLGNVAELTNQKYICKGGSFRQPAQDGLSGAYIRYSQPEQWIGFRCFAEYVFTPKEK
ncbi:Sulfatase-modifying factor enzyme 1 [Flexibacter flexilis DSM 6793]|uniref:Sulfatase-modifying factor enzyme 1 n=1 Tax=Flexibacter flexilis DSM 6793 TaxID=927664 RepID=A0A1I1H6G4_9BACT|nr:Sulfatase-modifying factor enzyme 1 [Flexibacter flexilis DSM 6793]